MTTQASTTQSSATQAPAMGARRSPAPWRRTLRRYIPPQHGAWAMLLLPWLTGTLVAGFRWLHIPLLLAWLTGYLASYYALLGVKTRRPRDAERQRSRTAQRWRGQLWAYGPPTLVLGALVLALRPAVLWYAPAYALLLAVNVAYAARRDDRALLNGLASVVQSCLMVFVCATVAGVPLAQVAGAFAAVTAYFVGTVLHVKAMIRERDNVQYRRMSIGYHLLAFGSAIWLGWAVAAVFALLAVRAWVLPGRDLTPGRIGVVEIVACLGLLAAILAG